MLNEKQRRFAEEYVIDLNATQAAKRAGYSEKTAYSMGHALLKNPEIQKLIGELIEERRKKTIASQDEVLEYLTRVVRGEETEDVIVSREEGIVHDQRTPSVKERTRAAELLGKRYGTWQENLNLEGTLGVQIVEDI